MSNIKSFELSSVDVVRPTVAKLGKVILLAPYMKALTDTVGAANSINIVNAAGFAVPDAAPSGALIAGALTGAYAYYITFYDQTNDRESNPSAQSATVNPSGQGIRVTNNATNNAANSRVTHWRIYRNIAGGATYYLVATVAIATGTYDDTNSDATIQANDVLLLDNTAPATDTYKSAKCFRNFCFLYGPDNAVGGTDYDHRVVWSKVGNNDSFPSLNETDFAQGQHGIIRALEPAGPALLLYKDRCIIRWIFRTDPSGIYGDGGNDVVNDQRGALNDRCVVNVQGTHFVIDRRGIYATRDGAVIDEIVYELDTFWQRINWAQREKFCASYDDRHIWFAVALDEDTENHWCFVLDRLAIDAKQGQRWFPEYYDFAIRDFDRQDCGMTSGATKYGMERKIVVVAIDDHMRQHIMAVGWRDGVSPELTAESTVAASGSSTTVVEAASGTYSATNNDSKTVDVKDMYLRWKDPDAIAASVNAPSDLDWRRAYRITNVSGTTLTVTPAMPVAPPAGATFWIGARPNAVMRTPQMHFGQPGLKKKLKGVRLQTQPGGMPIDMKMRVSADRMGWLEMQEDSDSDQSTYTMEKGHPDITVKLGGDFTEYTRKGLVELPSVTYWGYVWQVEFDASGPDRPVVIDQWELEPEFKEAG